MPWTGSKMNEKHLHIVTHDVPWPADFGGVVDLFYKLKALQQQGVSVHLHCFAYGRSPQAELEKYCCSVNYYPRKKNISGFSFRLPFIVSSRCCTALLENLQQDNYPILLEGIHCTYWLDTGALKGRKVLVRLHNTEFEYYRHLQRFENNPFKKLYFWHESRLLKKYEGRLASKAPFVAVSGHDVVLYKKIFGAKDISYLPVFIPHTLSNGPEGKGCFCLYHGNLSVNENEAAAIWLLEEVFNGTDIPFVIAGKSPSKKLQRVVAQNGKACLIADPSDAAMQDLIAKAQLHTLPSLNNTGVKLKLINALFNGRHCIVNEAGVEGSGLENACHVAADAAAFRSLVSSLYQQPFTHEEKENRQGLLQTMYNNELNAKRLIAQLY